MEESENIPQQSEDSARRPSPRPLSLPCPLCTKPVELLALSDREEAVCPSCGLSCTYQIPPPPELAKVDVELIAEPEPAELPPADDMTRWLAGEPIHDFPRTGYQKVRRFCKRNPLTTRFAVAATALLTIAMLTLGWNYFDTKAKLAHFEQFNQDQMDHKQMRLKTMQHNLQVQSQRQVEAEQQRRVAERESRVMRSKYLAAKSQSLASSQPRQGVQFAIDAVNVSLSHNEPLVPESHQSLRDLLVPFDGIRLEGSTGEITSLAVSFDSQKLAGGSADGKVLLWDLSRPSRPKIAARLEQHQDYVSDLSFSNDNRWLVSGGFDSLVCLWDMRAEDPAAMPWVLRGGGGPVYTVAMSADSRWLVAGGGDELQETGTARLWDLSEGISAALPTELKRNTGPVRTASISPNNRWLALGVDEAARLWDLSRRQPMVVSLVLQGHAGAISCTTFTKDNRWLVTCGGNNNADDSNIQLWDLSLSDPTNSILLRGHKGPIRVMAASDDSRWLFTGSEDRTVRVWDLLSKDSFGSSKVLSKTFEGIHSIAVSRDNRWLAVGEATGKVYLWSLSEQGVCSQPVVIDTGEDNLQAMVFSPDNQWLATAGGGTSVRIWNLNIDNMLAQATNFVSTCDRFAWLMDLPKLAHSTKVEDSLASTENGAPLHAQESVIKNFLQSIHTGFNQPMHLWQEVASYVPLLSGGSKGYAVRLAGDLLLNRPALDITPTPERKPSDLMRVDMQKPIQTKKSSHFMAKEVQPNETKLR